MEANPIPSKRTYGVLGLPHGAAVTRCIEAFQKLDKLYDPRAWPGDDQRWAIAMQDEADEALSVIVDAATDWGRAA